MFLSTLGLKSDGMVSAFKKARIESCTDFLTALKDKRGVAGRRRKQEAMAAAAAAASQNPAVSASTQIRPPPPAMPQPPPQQHMAIPVQNTVVASSTGGVHVAAPPPLTHTYSHAQVHPTHNATAVSLGSHYMHEMKSNQPINSAINLTLLK